jgi:hypothetical protein
LPWVHLIFSVVLVKSDNGRLFVASYKWFCENEDWALYKDFVPILTESPSGFVPTIIGHNPDFAPYRIRP